MCSGTEPRALALVHAEGTWILERERALTVRKFVVATNGPEPHITCNDCGYRQWAPSPLWQNGAPTSFLRPPRVKWLLIHIFNLLTERDHLQHGAISVDIPTLMEGDNRNMPLTCLFNIDPNLSANKLTWFDWLRLSFCYPTFDNIWAFLWLIVNFCSPFLWFVLLFGECCEHSPMQ